MDLQHYREILLDRRASLHEVMAASREDSAPVELDQTRVGRLSRMDALQRQAMAQATEERRLQELARIDAALKRIDDESFGICLLCDEDIEAKRLALDPTLPTCFDCAKG